VALATAFTGFSSVVVGGIPTGSFASVALGTAVTMSTFGWSPATTPVTPLWSFTSGGSLYSFDLLSVAVATQNSTFLNLTGTGTLKKGAPGALDPTTGVWSLSLSNPSGSDTTLSFTFQESTTAVPEGGSALSLLGISLVSLGVLRKKLARKA
jgi:hypothetical protein